MEAERSKQVTVAKPNQINSFSMEKLELQSIKKLVTGNIQRVTKDNTIVKTAQINCLW